MALRFLKLFIKIEKASLSPFEVSIYPESADVLAIYPVFARTLPLYCGEIIRCRNPPSIPDTGKESYNTFPHGCVFIYISREVIILGESLLPFDNPDPSSI